MASKDWTERDDIQETQEKKRRVTELTELKSDSKESIFSLLFTETKKEDNKI